MNNWKKLDEQVVYKGWRSIIKKTFELPDGKTFDFDIVGSNEYVIVAALTKEEEFILTRQFRPGPEEELVSFAEGGVESGESLETAAARELYEETGYQAGPIHFLKSFRSAYTNQHFHALLATECTFGGSQQLDQTEFIEVIRMPLEQFRNYIRLTTDHQFTNVQCAYLALDFLGKL